MNVTLDGRLLKATTQDNGNVRGTIFDGEEAVSFYAKPGKAADFLKAAFAESDVPLVLIEGQVYAGRDYDTRLPDGTLSLKVVHAETSTV
jgi:hypothetical protein